ncbi:hypothetical protein CH63R_04609 [Colletotrichum higginsianum IMI 349063]|uniref:Uncharacterized protein n=1 Tax=Colletotrichum higginsianum (strain IMI 349063) TaxID=759273 RepID=A0A1B7YJR7_COLHI|nr:hypothetical protein CH63R_04609 [Colletotrichum higginsianum IMI 349063]OBR12313.1 hypothetical protein CH63R_04609 [Colletotrichum higginsianum IMI 349063]
MHSLSPPKKGNPDRKKVREPTPAQQLTHFTPARLNGTSAWRPHLGTRDTAASLTPVPRSWFASPTSAASTATTHCIPVTTSRTFKARPSLVFCTTNRSASLSPNLFLFKCSYGTHRYYPARTLVTALALQPTVTHNSPPGSITTGHPPQYGWGQAAAAWPGPEESDAAFPFQGALDGCWRQFSTLAK